MSYFSPSDYVSLVAMTSGDLCSDVDRQRLHRRLIDLHNKLYPRIREYDLRLHPNPEIPGGVSQKSVSIPTIANTMTLIYLRSPAEAEVVESLMGRDALCATGDIEVQRHPVIELRITPDHFVVEFIIAPDAWYDQQNFIGKLSVYQNRQLFYQILTQLRADYLLGFWCGIHLDDTHLNTKHLPPAPILYEYLDTFADRRDWLRIGRWYTPNDTALDDNNVVEELFERIRDLYRVYTFMAWTSKNNFHSLYQKTLNDSNH